jgi:hypothetical protein
MVIQRVLFYATQRKRRISINGACILGHITVYFIENIVQISLLDSEKASRGIKKGNYSGQLLRFVARSAGDIDFPGTNSIHGASALPAPSGFSVDRR